MQILKIYLIFLASFPVEGAKVPVDDGQISIFLRKSTVFPSSQKINGKQQSEEIYHFVLENTAEEIKFILCHVEKNKNQTVKFLNRLNQDEILKIQMNFTLKSEKNTTAYEKILNDFGKNKDMQKKYNAQHAEYNKIIAFCDFFLKAKSKNEEMKTALENFLKQQSSKEKCKKAFYACTEKFFLCFKNIFKT